MYQTLVLIFQNKIYQMKTYKWLQYNQFGKNISLLLC